MTWNKVGKGVRRAADGFSSKIFRRMRHSESIYLRVSRGAELIGNVYSQRPSEVLQEMDFACACMQDVVRTRAKFRY